MQINTQGDGVGPVKKYSELTPEELKNPLLKDIPIWTEMMQFAEPMETSPFIETMFVRKRMEDQMVLVSSNIRTPAEAMKRATKQINDKIQENIKNDTALQKLYKSLQKGVK